MTKTLTEQYYDQILEDGFYYAKPNDDKNTFILGVHPWEIGQYQNCEVLAPVPSYEEWKRLQERNEKLEKMTFHYTPGEWNTMMRMTARLQEQLAIATKALEETRVKLLHVELSGLDYDNRHKMYDLMFTDGVIDKALKEMEGVK